MFALRASRPHPSRAPMRGPGDREVRRSQSRIRHVRHRADNRRTAYAAAYARLPADRSAVSSDAGIRSRPPPTRSKRSCTACGGRAGIATVGRKVGFANKAVWRVLKLETLVWAHMYDDTVRYADRNDARRCRSPRWSRRRSSRRSCSSWRGPHRAAYGDAGAACSRPSSGSRSDSRSSTACSPTGSSSRPTSSRRTACTRRSSSANRARCRTGGHSGARGAVARDSRCGCRETASWSRRVRQELAAQSGALPRRARRRRSRRQAGASRSPPASSSARAR